MIPLANLLERVPAVYAELGHALLPGRSGEPSDTSPDPRHRPAPARLEVTDHRHKLVRGLRWWVDVIAADTRVPVGESVPRMCAVILANLHVLEDEDAAELQANLWEWIGDAMPLVGAVPTPKAPALPREALDRVVPQSVAAAALDVHPTTILRRAGGKGGPVKLADVAGPLCVMSDLPLKWCAHCTRRSCEDSA